MRTNEQGFTISEFLFAVSVLVPIALGAAGCYVIYHFIQKFW